LGVVVLFVVGGLALGMFSDTIVGATDRCWRLVGAEFWVQGSLAVPPAAGLGVRNMQLALLAGADLL